MRRSANPGPLTIGRLAALTGVHISLTTVFEGEVRDF